MSCKWLTGDVVEVSRLYRNSIYRIISTATSADPVVLKTLLLPFCQSLILYGHKLRNFINVIMAPIPDSIDGKFTLSNQPGPPDLTNLP